MKIELTGNYIMVENPIYMKNKTEAGVLIPEEIQKNRMKKDMEEKNAQLDRMKVVQVGPAVIKAKAKDEIYINPSAFHPNMIQVVFEEKGYIIFREPDIVFYYE